MGVRSRKLVGAVLMLAFVTIYALLVMALAQASVVQNAPSYARWVFFAVGGLAWILPVMPLIRWMEQRPSS